MKTFTITKIRFLVWFFETGQDQERGDLRIDLAERVIQQLFDNNVSTVTTEDIFNECNQEAIRLSFIEEFDDNGFDEKLGRGYDDIELGELSNYKLKLI